MLNTCYSRRKDDRAGKFKSTQDCLSFDDYFNDNRVITFLRPQEVGCDWLG